jgi:GNAT superfamily N-acetyltransferase
MFREPFFNRAGALTCMGASRIAALAEKNLTASGMAPTILVFDSCIRATEVLRESGYKPVDKMTVLLSNRSLETKSAIQASITPRPSAESWTRAYLKAFYGDEVLAPSVVPIASRLLKLRAVTLLETRIAGEVAGVLAIFRTKGLAGVYCVGVVPEYRRRGVASRLFDQAKEIAEAEGREMILQTLASDGAEHFYAKRGFVPLYSKQMLSKESPHATQKESN